MHDGYARNSSLSDPASRVSSKCFTHAMIGDVRLLRRVFEADTIIVSCGLEEFERTSWSKQHTHKFGGSHDELATVADYDKFVESIKNNYPEVCDARSPWMINCRKLDCTDRDKKLKIHVGRNSRIMISGLGSRDHHELHNHLYVGISRFLSAKNVLIIICENGRCNSEANAELWSSTLTHAPGSVRNAEGSLQKPFKYTTTAFVPNVHDLLLRSVRRQRIGSDHDGKATARVMKGARV